jgi:hypothetical protein
MEFVTTQKGGKMLIYEGLKYTVNRNGNDIWVLTPGEVQDSKICDTRG